MLAVATTGRHFGRGGAFYYDLNGPGITDGNVRSPNFFPSRGNEIIQRTRGFQNVYNILSYYGNSICPNLFCLYNCCLYDCQHLSLSVNVSVCWSVYLSVSQCQSV